MTERSVQAGDKVRILEGPGKGRIGTVMLVSSWLPWSDVLVPSETGLVTRSIPLARL